MQKSLNDPSNFGRVWCPCLPSRSPGDDRRLIWSAAFFALLAVMVGPFDLWIAIWVGSGKIPGDIERALNWSEAMAHGLGVAMICGTLAYYDTARRRLILRVAGVAYCAGLFADGLKLCVGRMRPASLLNDPVFEQVAEQAQSFCGWFPFLHKPANEAFDHAIQSFPSAHAATGVALAVSLSRLYPRTGLLFALLALLSCLQRVACLAHYPSDVLVGCAVGLISVRVLGAIPVNIRFKTRVGDSSMREGEPLRKVAV